MTVAIVDYGMGNLYSVQRACAAVGLEAQITTSADAVRAAKGIIVPGVGAFGGAMAALKGLGLDAAIVEAARGGTPLLGICLGMQLLLQRSHEFGVHEGLGLVPGEVVRLPDGQREAGLVKKVPHIGWTPVKAARPSGFTGTVLESLQPDEHLFFVHSFYVRPDVSRAPTGLARFGELEFCAALELDNVSACQFHPERSGPAGLSIYRAWGRRLGARG